MKARLKLFMIPIGFIISMTLIVLFFGSLVDTGVAIGLGIVALAGSIIIVCNTGNTLYWVLTGKQEILNTYGCTWIKALATYHGYLDEPKPHKKSFPRSKGSIPEPSEGESILR